jgi:lipoprotein-anchoring transpeptidase ErfK/SrfK
MENEPDSLPAPVLRVDVSGQLLHLLSNGVAVKSWPVSTSKFGLGSEPGSNRTPVGNFRVCEKFGDGQPAWSVFRSRLPTGEIASQGAGEDGVLSRILWLDGLDGDNANTRDRYIYIHGTNEEHLIGSPASHGCIRLKNADVIELFALVPTGTRVEIA